MDIPSKAPSKKFLSVLGVIVLGAIGSGFWDVCLKTVLFKLSVPFANFANAVYSGYFDSLYEGVGAGRSYLLANMLGTLFMLAVISSPIIIMVYLRKLYKEWDATVAAHFCDTPSTKKNRTNVAVGTFVLTKRITTYCICFAMYGSMSLFYLNIFIKYASNNSAVIYVDQSIELVRPYITEKDYISFRSKFRQIDDLKKFQNMVTELNEIAFANAVKLPKLNCLGVKVPTNAKSGKDSSAI